MRALLLILVACSGSSNCPTAAQVGGDEAEAKIVVARCRADGWSKEVTDCLKAAKDQEAQEPCFRKLDKSQQAKLKTAFAPMYEQHDRAERADAIAHFAEDIAALHLDELIARAPSCADYRSALDAARNALAKCDGSRTSLEAFGMREKARADVTALRALPDAQLGAECTARAKAFPVASCP